MAVAIFDYVRWVTAYPEFAKVTEEQANELFEMATLYLDNTDGSPVVDVNRRLMLLNIVTAHLAALGPGVNGVAGSGLVGRITSASEGSVSVSVDAGTAEGIANWFMQTKYGAAFWWATQRFRLFRYVPGPTRLSTRLSSRFPRDY